LFGSLSRIFTTLQEVPDKVILYSFVAGFILNAVLALQMLMYWNAPASKKTTEHKLTPAAQRDIMQYSNYLLLCMTYRPIISSLSPA
jgi:mannose-P-dolichol utilization defect protein 1